jgi:hypothetical protein
MTSYDTGARKDGSLLPLLTMEDLRLRAQDRYPLDE